MILFWGYYLWRFWRGRCLLVPLKIVEISSIKKGAFSWVLEWEIFRLRAICIADNPKKGSLIFSNSLFQIILRIAPVEALWLSKIFVVIALSKLVISNGISCIILMIFKTLPADFIWESSLLGTIVIFYLSMRWKTTKGYHRFTITELAKVTCCNTLVMHLHP